MDLSNTTRYPTDDLLHIFGATHDHVTQLLGPLKRWNELTTSVAYAELKGLPIRGQPLTHDGWAVPCGYRFTAKRHVPSLEVRVPRAGLDPQCLATIGVYALYVLHGRCGREIPRAVRLGLTEVAADWMEQTVIDDPALPIAMLTSPDDRARMEEVRVLQKRCDALKAEQREIEIVASRLYCEIRALELTLFEHAVYGFKVT